MSNHQKEKGFTFMEIIITLVVAGILGAMLVPLMGTNLLSSATAVVRVQNHYNLTEIMDKITIDYKKLMAADSTTALETLKGYIENGNSSDNDPYYGEYTWATKYIAFDPGTDTEKSEAEGDTILKITVTRDEQTIVSLFTQ
jgi:prepilin-type N-terminal cleavage/methylation domain-containing protein